MHSPERISERLSRRTVLKTAAATGIGVGFSAVVSAQQEATTYKLGGKIGGWQGQSPSQIAETVNPTLQFRAGTEYTVTWENQDGAPHNFAILDEQGNVVHRTEIMSSQFTTQTTTFTATEKMATYLCQVHPTSMRGQVEVDGKAETTQTATRQGGAYDWQEATWDSYWYSLYNMNSTIAVSGVGVVFPHTDEQTTTFKKRLKGIVKNSDVDRPAVKTPNLNLAPFTEGDPHFTQKPVAPFSADVERIDANTLAWDRAKMSHVVSPSSLAWTHLKGVTWAKNFENHFDILPTNMAPKFRSQMLATMGQLAIKFALIEGMLRKSQDSFVLVSRFNPKKGSVVDSKPRPMHHAAMVWFLSEMVSLATGGWYGYEHPTPLIPAQKLQKLTDQVATATMETFSPETIVQMGTTRDLGVMLGAMGWYGTHAGTEKRRKRAAKYANSLASTVTQHLADTGKVKQGGQNQAATQGAVGQGLLWASQVDDVDHQDMAQSVLGYLLDTLWNSEVGTFADGTGSGTYTITVRDAGSITGGLNAADAVLGVDGVQEKYASYFDQTFNRGRLQRAERPQSRDEDAQYTLPLPQNAGGEFGQAAVYNTEVTYDTTADEWTVSNDRFTTAQALYTANQDIWIGRWEGDAFNGRGVPGKTDTPETTTEQDTTEQETTAGNDNGR